MFTVQDYPGSVFPRRDDECAAQIAHSQDWQNAAANVEENVSRFTICYRDIPDDAERGAVEGALRARGAQMTWQMNPRYARAYALVEGCDPEGAADLKSTARATVFGTAIIALAVSPSAPEALRGIADALGGPGRPAGIVATSDCDGGLIVEWDLDRTPVGIVLGLVDVELRRFLAGRRTELLSPLPLAWWTQIASDGLAAPQIAPDRVLEALLEQSGVVH